MALPAVALVRVLLSGLSGKRMELEAKPHTTVRDLKKQVADHWNIPAIFQRWCVGMKVLGDLELLTDQDQCGAKAIEVTVAMSLDEVDSASLDARLEAVRRLSELGPISQDAGLTAAIGRLEDEDSAVRRAALWALEVHAKKGDNRVIDAGIARLEDPEPGVRISAVDMLRVVVDTSNERVIAAVKLQLDHPAWGLRVAAVQTLSVLASKADEHIIAAVIERLKTPGEGIVHMEQGVWKTAVVKLGAIQRAIQQLEDRPTLHWP